MKRLLAQKTDAVIDDYMSSLLADITFEHDKDDAVNEPISVSALPLAQVQKGCELVVLWQEPLTDCQRVIKHLMLLSLAKTLPASRLKVVILNEIRA